mmetsp:Transcript_76197/g.215618  ORF Transcript_76197/g.215618 Transcript_76197/m.215618 type:complete len:244 (-) Transcript_76197:444-1175(-)
MSVRRLISSNCLWNLICVLAVNFACSSGMNVQMNLRRACGSAVLDICCFMPCQPCGSVTLTGLPSRSCTSTNSLTNCRIRSSSSWVTRVVWNIGMPAMELLLPRLSTAIALKSCLGMPMVSGLYPRKRHVWATWLPHVARGRCGIGKQTLPAWLLPFAVLFLATDGDNLELLDSSPSELSEPGLELESPRRCGAAERRRQQQKPRILLAPACACARTAWGSALGTWSTMRSISLMLTGLVPTR